MGTRDELSAWLMPPMAREEWLRLTSLLDLLPDSEVPCRAGDSEHWWPDKKGVNSVDTLGTIAACHDCSARIACLDYALAADERFGIWGATLPEARKTLRYQRSAA